MQWTAFIYGHVVCHLLLSKDVLHCPGQLCSQATGRLCMAQTQWWLPLSSLHTSSFSQLRNSSHVCPSAGIAPPLLAHQSQLSLQSPGQIGPPLTFSGLKARVQMDSHTL